MCASQFNRAIDGRLAPLTRGAEASGGCCDARKISQCSLESLSGYTLAYQDPPLARFGIEVDDAEEYHGKVHLLQIKPLHMTI
jgi:hypothetical protein